MIVSLFTIKYKLGQTIGTEGLNRLSRLTLNSTSHAQKQMQTKIFNEITKKQSFKKQKQKKN